LIDAKAARNDPDTYRAALARKGAAEAFDAWLEADERWRELVPKVDDLRSRQKQQGKPTPEQVDELKQVKEELRLTEEQLAAAAAARDAALEALPNPPHPDVPDGETEDDAAEIRRWGEPPKLEHPRDHLELGRFEMERAARLSGSRFGYIVGDSALLEQAIFRLAISRLVEGGFTLMRPPVLVREQAMYGTGFFPTEKSNIYEIPSDGLYLTGTSEVALAGFHMDEILEAGSLPLHYAGYSTCFRREAGAAGKDTRGMFRVHQFDKVEMFVYCRPEESWDEHERLLAIEEELVQTVGLPYRVVDVAAGDLGAPAARKYDVEAWFPSQERYREITSCSNTTDFRRGGCRSASDRTAGRSRCTRSTAPRRPIAGCSPCWRTSSEKTGRSRFPRRCGSTEHRRRSGRRSLRRGRTDVESAPLLEIALRRVKSVLTSVQVLLETLELGLAHVQRPLPPLDRRLEVRGLRLARAEPLLGDRQPGAALGQLGRELIQLRLALVEFRELLLCLLDPPLLFAEIAQPVRDLGLGGGEPACAGFELLRQQIDPRLTLVDLGRAAPRILLARLELGQAPLRLCKELLCAHLVRFQARPDARQLGLTWCERCHGGFAGLDLGKPAR
jgi:seryl-tRNA synthetase